jgi:hypothetical protein
MLEMQTSSEQHLSIAAAVAALYIIGLLVPV